MIVFGTDGWRGVIGEEFTFENVRMVAQAVADYILSEEKGVRSQESQNTASSASSLLTPPSSLVVGYDTRFLSDQFARETAVVLAANGIKVFLTETFAPTPAVSYAITDKKADGGVMLTASHNPYAYNGFKFKASYGGSAPLPVTAKIEACLRENEQAGKAPASGDFESLVAKGLIVPFDPKPEYLRHVSSLIDASHIQGTDMGVVADPMYGAGQGYVPALLEPFGVSTREVRAWRDARFGGGGPEPIAQNLDELIDAVTGTNEFGIALDGDADRLGVIDGNGSFVNSHMIFALLLRYLHEEKGMSGEVVKTVSTTSLIDEMGKEYGLPITVTPIGFKYICERMLAGDVLIGGEESGGIGVKGHIPERDGILIGALVVEMVHYYSKTLSELWSELEEKYGPYRYHRIDIKAANTRAISSYLTKHPAVTLAGTPVERIGTEDGVKFTLADTGWLMIRPSGTEDIVRIYAEARSEDKVYALLEEGKRLAKEATA